MHRTTPSRAFLASLLLACPALAGAHRAPFPADLVRDEGALAGVELALRADEAAALAAHDAVELAGFRLPGGARVDLALERVDLDVGATDVRDGGDSVARLSPRDLTLWSGTVAGEPASDVYLALSRYGTRGWIRRDGELVHLLAGPGEGGDWSRARTRVVSETALAATSGPRPRLCADEAVRLPGGAAPSVPVAAPGGTVALGGPNDTLLCRMAVETDWQLFQKFQALAPTHAYVTSLFGAMALRFQQQCNVRLELAYLGLHSTSNDGWTSNDQGLGSGAMLDEFRTAWAGNIPDDADLAHFVSGAPLGGGVAYLDVLCNQDWGFAVSGDLAGNTPFPVVQGPLTWDFFVFAHETGHNFGSPHTHDFCPPLDQCAGSCQPGTQCIPNGTIMSYCHGCPGGMNNILPQFHPTCATLMRTESQNSCLPAWCLPPSRICFPSANSYSAGGAYMEHAGTNFVSQNDLVLIAVGVPPGSLARFVYGPSETLTPLGNGWQCVAAPFVRLPVTTANFAGDVAWNLDLGALPPAGPIAPGDTRLFQCWFRDVAAGGAMFNLSDGLSVTFCP